MRRSLPEAYGDVTAEQLREIGLRAVVMPLKDVVVDDARPALLMLTAAAIFLLLIMWANATNLTLLRAERQRREVAVMRALGCHGGHLARRFLFETVLLAVLGGSLGLVLASAAIRMRFGFDVNAIPRLRDLSVDTSVIAAVAGLSLFSAAVLGLVALLSAAGPTVSGALTGGFGRVTAGRRMQLGRQFLVGSQVALALTLLVGSALMTQSFWRLKQVSVGFEPEGALTFHLSIPASQYTNYHAAARVHHEALEGLRALPGVMAVEAASLSGFPLTPPQEYDRTRIAVAERMGENIEAWPYALFGFATPGYFSAMGIPVLQGRTFQSVDTSDDAPGIILSASLARALFGGEDPIGRRVRTPPEPSRWPDHVVVGVVGDVPGNALRTGPSQTFYFPNLHPPRAADITGVVHPYLPSHEVYIIRTSLPPTGLVPAIRERVRDVDPRLVITDIVTLEGIIAASRREARLTMLLLLVGAGTALFLALVGIYGVLSYAVAQRTSEFGVRIALGSSPAGIVRMVVRQGARLMLAGIVVGLPAAFALTRLLDRLLYDVSPSDPLAFIATAALLFAVGVAASYLSARRAGGIDPVRALKAE